ncbi:unnamed protein product [Dicrocoelium dendriticum]|nr:unnamed protein product [Dicrocoelium dendriticum]
MEQWSNAKMLDSFTAHKSCSGPQRLVRTQLMRRSYSLLSARLRPHFIPLYPKYGTSCGGTKLKTCNKL